MQFLQRSLFIALCLSIPFITHAQVFYQHDTSIKVIAYGQQQTLAWSGGYNNPQFSMADLNRDGVQDLVIFEPWNSVRTFINKGTPGNPAYRYAPEYAANFPPVFSYLVLLDYNCDGIADLFHRGTTGFEVYKGYYNGYNQLCFTFYQDLYYSNDSYIGTSVNAFNNPGDIPAIVDVDNDGDLDFIAYDISGGFTNLYKNMRVEMGLPCDSIHIALKDRCWGRVYQGFFRTHALQRSCDNTHLRGDGSKKTHSGNSPMLFDWDMDGDYDYLDGSVSFNEMTFLKNGRVEYGGPDSAVAQDTMWQSGGKTISIPVWPAAFNIDIDQDGKKDLLVAPNASGNASENYKCIWYYKNYTTPGVPDWRFQSDSFLTDKTIDLGSYAYPALYDFNKDGKPDLFIGSDGYHQSTGSPLSKVSYYLNTSTPGNPSFTLQTKDFLNISSYNFYGSSPAFGDVDGDSLADMIIGHVNGTLSYFHNVAPADTVAPDWHLALLVLTDINSDTINVGGHAAPFVYDIDKDGKKDLVIGDITGHIQYYRNESTTPGSIALRLVTTQLGHAKADTNRSYNIDAAPFIGKIDSTGIEYLLLGSSSGNIYRFTGFQSGDTNATYTMLDANYAYIDSTYSAYNHPGTLYGLYDGLRSAPVVGDIAGDTTYFMFVGNNKGGVECYKNKAYVPPVDHTRVGSSALGSVVVYPNPASNLINISWSGLPQAEVHIVFMNMAGQVIFCATTAPQPDHITLPLSSLPDGVYVCVVQSGTERYYSKVTVIR